MSDAETPVPGCLAFAVPCPSWSFSVGSAMSRGAERIAMDLLENHSRRQMRGSVRGKNGRSSALCQDAGSDADGVKAAARTEFQIQTARVI